MYFENAGEKNTEATLRAAFECAREQNIRKLVVASTEGGTGALTAELAEDNGVDIIVVTHNTGFSDHGIQQLKAENRARIEKAGAVIHTGTLVFRGSGSAIRKKLGWSEEELMASVLRLFGQGMKVCVEMAAMVADAGLVSGEDIICVAGTGSGADTAVVISPAPSNKLFDLKVREIIAKPRDF